jgi:hypothetical protein
MSTTEGQKQFMQRWLEPPVQVKASYHDAGLVRHGVFENMAPLGTLPKVGLFKKTAPPPAAAPEHTPAPPPVRIVIKPRSTAPITPVPAPPPAPEEDETEEEDDANTEDLEGPAQDDVEADGDDEAAEDEDNKSRAAPAASRLRRSVVSAGTDDEDWAPAKSGQKGAGRRSLSRVSARRLSSASSLQQPAASASSRRVDPKEIIDKVVEAAVDEALIHFRYPTAWALRTLYDENSSRPEFLSMIEKVFMQTADADTLEEFARLIQSKKKQAKKDNKGYSYFVPPSANSHSTPPKPKRAPYGNLVRFDLSTLHLDRPGKSQKIERPAPEPEPEADRDLEPQPEPEPEPEPELHPRKKRKSGKHSEPASKMTANGVNAKANGETPSRRRARARSMSSTSSLSSARSLSPPAEIPESDAGDEGEGFDETPSRTSPALPQPITAKRRRSNAPRKSRNVSPSRRSPAASTAPQQPQKQQATAPSQRSAPSQRQSPAAEQPAGEAVQQPYEMPAVVDSPLFPNLNSKKGGRAGTSTPVIFASKVGKIDENDTKQRLRQSARNVTANHDEPVPVSHARRGSSQVASQQEESNRATTPVPASRPRTALVAARPTPAPREGRSTRSALKRTYDDLEEQASPTTSNFPGSEAASMVADSRAGTPALRAAKKPRTGLRIKHS